ncbi:hypothetical protein [Poseidonocella sp. HB161398]|uniref:hypothetical protein n=1 Tax=Poseidonocella sp. HB161398 TaxID=2320855 RepID=UPI001109F77C|nr:hypothetical protein [Poseidonocella sp. HB161398]
MSAALPPFHLRFPRPLVVDVDHALLSGARPGRAPADPRLLRINRPALELLRLWRRFRGQVRLLTALPEGWDQWLGELLGLAGKVIRTGRRTEDMAMTTLTQFETRGFDLIGGGEIVSAIGAYAHRLWLVGERGGLRSGMRTSGVPLVALEAADTVAVSEIAGGGQGWTLPAAAPASPLSIEVNRRYHP